MSVACKIFEIPRRTPRRPYRPSFPRSSVGMPPRTLRVLGMTTHGVADAEHRRLHSHAERGNELV